MSDCGEYMSNSDKKEYILFGVCHQAPVLYLMIGCIAAYAWSQADVPGNTSVRKYCTFVKNRKRPATLTPRFLSAFPLMFGTMNII